MANVIIDNSNLTNIANAIRSKKGVETQYKPSEMAAAVASIETFKPEETFNVTPTTSAQTITPTAGHVFSGGTVQAMPNGTMGTVSAAKTISGNTATITPSISAGTAGYNTHAAASGTAVTVQASELVSGTVTVTPKITSQSTDVTNYASVTTNPIYEEISTSAEMDAILADSSNVGKWYKYIGSSTSSYIQNRIYQMEQGPNTITISRKGHSTYAYISVNGTQYTSVGTYSFPYGTQVQLHVGFTMAEQEMYRIGTSSIYVYNRTIFDGYSEYTYNLTLDRDISIRMDYQSSGSYNKYGYINVDAN